MQVDGAVGGGGCDDGGDDDDYDAEDAAVPSQFA